MDLIVKLCSQIAGMTFFSHQDNFTAFIVKLIYLTMFTNITTAKSELHEDAILMYLLQ